MQSLKYNYKCSSNNAIHCYASNVHTMHTHNGSNHDCVIGPETSAPHTGHSPLLAAYLHRIGCRDSATCVHRNGADETAEHLVLHRPAHDQAWQESWPNLHYQSDPRCLWSFLERIGAVTRPPDRE